MKKTIPVHCTTHPHSDLVHMTKQSTSNIGNQAIKEQVKNDTSIFPNFDNKTPPVKKYPGIIHDNSLFGQKYDSESEDGVLFGTSINDDEISLSEMSSVKSKQMLSKILSCPVCNTKYKTPAGLYKHKRAKHPYMINSTTSIPCNETNCRDKFKTLNILRNHLQKVHGMNMDTMTMNFKDNKGR